MLMKRNTISVIMGRLVVQENGCCIWPGARSTGYGYVKWMNKNRLVHRLLYEHFIGSVPKGLELDHLCRNRACANFAHLEPVTRRENVLRGESRQAVNARRTHCINGHLLDEKNTHYYGPGHRQCRQCHNRVANACYHRKRAALKGAIDA